MTLEEFKDFADDQIRKKRDAQKQELEDRQRRLSNYRSQGLKQDFIMKEGHYWLVVKNNQIADVCDTKGEAWQQLYS